MADADSTIHSAPPVSAGPSRSSSSRPDMEGLGKFKLASAQPAPKGAGNTYKAKFFVLKESYDAVTAKREELSKEFENANTKLKDIQAENDLLLDAMGIVAPSQPSLVSILQQMESEPTSVPISLVDAGEPEIYQGPPLATTTSSSRHVIPDYPYSHSQSQSSFASSEQEQRPAGPIVDAAALNGNGNRHGYTHHAPVHVANGRARSRVSATTHDESRHDLDREPSRGEGEETADQEMLDDVHV